ncbi:MAG: M20/M25/M40 family metallo-hydrolase, partial [Acidobacteriaceae bacterium]|nr:M20/M25/M40 family metallo-hydrolase [Acidobacteriaceae bacterium]
MKRSLASPDMHPYLAYCRTNQPQIARCIEEMVCCESPTDSPRHVDRFVDLLIERTKDIARAKAIRVEGYGRNVRLEFRTAGRKKEGQILGLGHSDTVWPLGTLRHMPFREAEGRLWGPGVLDMKSGLALFIYAVRALIDLGVQVRRRIVLLIVSDEEVGSPMSRPITEAEARNSRSVLVVEPGT